MIKTEVKQEITDGYSLDGGHQCCVFRDFSRSVSNKTCKTKGAFIPFFMALTFGFLGQVVILTVVFCLDSTQAASGSLVTKVLFVTTGKH